MEPIAVHVVFQLGGGNDPSAVAGRVGSVGSAMDEFAILIDVVVAIGTVLDGRPAQSGGFTFEELRGVSLQVVRDIEGGGEAKHMADGGAAAVFFAAVHTLFDTPEVVGVVPQRRQGVRGGQLVGPVGDDGRRVVVVVFRPVGAAEHKTILGAVRVELPTKDDAGRLDVVGIVDRIHCDGGSCARQVFDVDFHFVVGIG